MTNKNITFTNLTLDFVEQNKPFGFTYPIYIVKSTLDYLSQLVIMNKYNDDLGPCTAAFLTLDGVPVMIHQYEHPNIASHEFTISVDHTTVEATGKDDFEIADKLIQALGLTRSYCIIWENEELHTLQT